MHKRRRDGNPEAPGEPILVDRVQTGVRLEKRILKVLKTLAEYHDITLGDLIEGIVLHVFDGKMPFDQANLKRIEGLRQFYGLDLRADASHRLSEKRDVSQKRGKE
ncbi:MAG: hypothetical protein HYX75_00990 [Acidobacteria bacterium]|nr:hypothetical protein [Acidobacteriota bacterium]